MESYDANYVEKVLSFFGHQEVGGITEVRIFPHEPYLNIKKNRFYVGKVVSGYYTDYHKASRDISFLDGKGNIYFAINPVQKDLLARAANRLQKAAKTTTSDDEILADSWLFLDMDPVRPSDISSTNEELQKALKKRDEVAEYLSQWCTPIKGLSGNGGHLLVKVANGSLTGYPNSDETRKKKERIVKFLSQQFSDNAVSVDNTVFNMARLCKLYGTMAVKGDNIPDRPHRRSFLEIPDTIPGPVDLYSILSNFLPFDTPSATQDKPSEEEIQARLTSESNDEYPFLEVEPYLQVAQRDGNCGDWRIKEKGNVTWFQFEECPVHTDADGDKWECAICQYSDGKMGAKCMHEPTYNWQDFKDVLGDPRQFYRGKGSSVKTRRESATSGGEPGDQKGKNPKGRDETPPKDSDGKKPSASDVANSWLNKYGFQRGELSLRYYREDWWTWNGKIYGNLPSYDIRAMIARFIDKQTTIDVTKNFVGNVVETLTGKCLISSKVEMPALLGEKVETIGRTIIFENGWLNLDALIAGEETELQAHTPKLFSTNALPYQFDEESNCPKWLGFLNCNLEGDIDRINVLQDFTGYCLLSHNLKFHKFLLLEGEAGTGKSTFCKVLRALLGEMNVSHVPLELFGERFALYPTLNKLVNIVEEVGELDTVAEGQLKAFTSGSPMQFERKYKEPIMATPTAKLILATNNRPRLKDRSGGIWRRVILVPWQKVIPETEWDRELDMKIINDELPGVFLWALAGLARLLENNGFSSSEIVTTATEEYKLEENPTRIFLLDNYEEAEGYVEVKEIYSEYVTWCKDFGYESLNNLTFGKEVRRAFPKVANKMGSVDTGKRCRIYLGIVSKT